MWSDGAADLPGTTGARPLLSLRGLNVKYAIRGGVIPRVRGYVHAVEDVSLEIGRGETLGLVGESGSGKSTIGRSVVGLLKPSSGNLQFDGQSIATLEGADLKRFKRRVQMVFQDPYSSLNPRQTAGDAVAEPLKVHGLSSGPALRSRVAELFDLVGLRPERMSSYPAEFSGGQRQRICIARALALSPDLIVADEVVSALDVSVQAQIINLFRRLQAEFGLSLLFVSHDLAVVATISSHVAVMYLGRVVEHAPRRQLFARPLHPYTEALVAAVPIADPNRRRQISPIGEIPSATMRPSGCHYHTRCPLVEAICRKERPAFVELAPGHWAACHVRQRAARKA